MIVAHIYVFKRQAPCFCELATASQIFSFASINCQTFLAVNFKQNEALERLYIGECVCVSPLFCFYFISNEKLTEIKIVL